MIEDLDTIWPDSAVTATTTNAVYDPLLFLTEKNRTLFLVNRHQSGWQRNVTTTVSLVANPLIRQTSTRVSGIVGEPVTYVWLCAAEALSPLQCADHGCPLYAVELHGDKLNYRFQCTMKCFNKTRFWLVVAEYDGAMGFKWNAVDGNFRTMGPVRTRDDNTVPLQFYYALQDELKAIREGQDLLRQEIVRLSQRQHQASRTATCMRPEDGSGHEFRPMNENGRYLFCYNCGKIISPYT